MYVKLSRVLHELPTSFLNKETVFIQGKIQKLLLRFELMTETSKSFKKNIHLGTNCTLTFFVYFLPKLFAQRGQTEYFLKVISVINSNIGDLCILPFYLAPIEPGMNKKQNSTRQPPQDSNKKMVHRLPIATTHFC